MYQVYIRSITHNTSTICAQVEVQLACETRALCSPLITLCNWASEAGDVHVDQLCYSIYSIVCATYAISGHEQSCV